MKSLSLAVFLVIISTGSLVGQVTAMASRLPGTGRWFLLAAGLTVLTLLRGGAKLGRSGAISGRGVSMTTKCMIAILFGFIAPTAFAQVNLATITPGSGLVSGITETKITASGFPNGTIPAADITVSFAATCGGPAKATTQVNHITRIEILGVLTPIGDVTFTVPTGLVPGTTYSVSIADTVGGDPDFTSKNCVSAKIAGSAPILNACIAGSSLGILLPKAGATGTVTAYVPKGYWSGSTTGVFVKNIEGPLVAGSTIATPNVPNSCSSNPASGQTVCVANNTDVYLISGNTLNATLTSGSDTTAGFSGGTCNNCGVALNSNNNTAVINMGLNGAASNSGVQVLSLNTDTFTASLPMIQEVSENISVDPTRSLILSANEDGNYVIDQIQSNGSLKEFDPSFSSGFEDDSSAEDCSTGIAYAPGEFTNSIQMVNLNDIAFNSPVVGAYTAPQTSVSLVTNYGFSAGLSGSAMAQGSGHLGVVTGEFGGNTFAVLKLPAAAGTGIPSLVDYAVAAIPDNALCGGTFQAGFDPHTVTAYTSPNTGDSYAVFAGYVSGVPACLAVVDMTTAINPVLTPRGGSGFQPNDIAPANLPASAVKFFSLP